MYEPVDYGVRIPISAPNIIDGEAYGDWEGYALSLPDGPELQSVCLRKGADEIGIELCRPFFGEEDSLNKRAAAHALWNIAAEEKTRAALRDKWAEHVIDRREGARADACWNADKEARP